MDTIGFIGVGKIGLPICEHLIKGGYRVLGYRRGSLADFEKIGGVAAKSPAQIGAQADIVFTCLPRTQRWKKSYWGRTAWSIPRGPARSWSSSARIPFR